MEGPLNLFLNFHQVVDLKRRDGYMDFLPWGWYMVVQLNPLCRELIDGKLGGQMGAVVH